GVVLMRRSQLSLLGDRGRRRRTGPRSGPGPTREASPGYRNANPLSANATTANTADGTIVTHLPGPRPGTAVSDILVPPAHGCLSTHSVTESRPPSPG